MKIGVAVFIYVMFSFLIYAQAEPLIKIGVLTDLSGVASYYGNQTRVGAILAEQELKEQGANLQVIFDDTMLSTTQTISAAQKLLYFDHVDALYVDFTISAIAVSSLVIQNKKLLLYGAAAESVARSNPYAFKSYSDYSMGCEALTREFKKRGAKVIAVLKTDTEYGELCLAGAKKANPDVLSISYKQGESVNSQVLAMKQKGAEALINASFELDVLNMIHAAKTLNYYPRIGAPEDALYTKQAFDKYNNLLEGAMSFGIKQLPPALIDKAKTIPGGNMLVGFEGTLFGYLHIRQMYQALKSCPEKQSECVVSKFSESKSEPELGFEGWKNHLARMQTIIKEYNNGQIREIGSYLSE